MRRTLWIYLAALLLVLGGLVFVGCAKDDSAACGDTDGAAPVDTKLLAFLSKAKSAHHIADQFEADGELDRAVETLRKLFDGSADESSAEVREVLADTRARVAELESQLGRFDQAANDVDRGLELAKDPTYFRGHLFEVRGLVEERRSKALKEKGDTAGAEASKKKALEAFEQAMSIQDQVIKKALPEEDAK
jgi:tetratricopeptide (TPR) repeat protein